MNIKDKFKNAFLFGDKYKTDSDSVIIACYFNPQRNPYRLKAFREFYNSVKHMDILITECVLEGTEPELVNEFPDIRIGRVWTKNLLWHKEALLNNLIQQLPSKYKYVFWVDADVLFTNKNWLVEASNKLRQGANLIQPFEYCVHLEKDELEPSFSLDVQTIFVDSEFRHPMVWKSFGVNHVNCTSGDNDYNKHGHVGFAWGAKREILESVPLYDRALVGGSDHIIAHAGAGHINHLCITKAFIDDIDAVNKWSLDFYNVVKGKIDYVRGDLYHIWHGDISKRNYLNRIKEFTPQTKTIINKDKNGLYIADNDEDKYVKEYFDKREVKVGDKVTNNTTTKVRANRDNTSKSVYYEKRAELQAKYPNHDDSFIDSIIWGYITDSTPMGAVMGGNIMGAMIGDALNTNDNTNIEFGGGSFGGGGAGGDWEENTNNMTDTNDTSTETFS
jgi:hypothetical protein